MHQCRFSVRCCWFMFLLCPAAAAYAWMLLVGAMSAVTAVANTHLHIQLSAEGASPIAGIIHKTSTVHGAQQTCSHALKYSCPRVALSSQGLRGHTAFSQRNPQQGGRPAGHQPAHESYTTGCRCIRPCSRSRGCTSSTCIARYTSQAWKPTVYNV